ncbi:ATP-binding protein [Yinghuangia aomiensis]
MVNPQQVRTVAAWVTTAECLMRDSTDELPAAAVIDELVQNRPLGELTALLLRVRRRGHRAYGPGRRRRPHAGPQRVHGPAHNLVIVRCSVDTRPPGSTGPFRTGVLTPPPVMCPLPGTVSRPSPASDYPVVCGSFDGTDAKSVREARRFVLWQCQEWDIEGDTQDDALRIASELASNAHQHSGSSQFDVCVMVAIATTYRASCLYLEVKDYGRWNDLEPAEWSPDVAETGRGWSIVQALASDSGAVHVPGVGTTAWAYLPVPSVHQPDREAKPAAPAA